MTTGTDDAIKQIDDLARLLKQAVKDGARVEFQASTPPVPDVLKDALETGRIHWKPGPTTNINITLKRPH